MNVIYPFFNFTKLCQSSKHQFRRKNTNVHDLNDIKLNIIKVSESVPNEVVRSMVYGNFLFWLKMWSFWYVRKVRYGNHAPDEKTRFCFDGFFDFLIMWWFGHFIKLWFIFLRFFSRPKNLLDPVTWQYHQTDGKWKNQKIY